MSALIITVKQPPPPPLSSGPWDVSTSQLRDSNWKASGVFVAGLGRGNKSCQGTVQNCMSPCFCFFLKPAWSWRRCGLWSAPLWFCFRLAVTMAASLPRSSIIRLEKGYLANVSSSFFFHVTHRNTARGRFAPGVGITANIWQTQWHSETNNKGRPRAWIGCFLYHVMTRGTELPVNPCLSTLIFHFICIYIYSLLTSAISEPISVKPEGEGQPELLSCS